MTTPARFDLEMYRGDDYWHEFIFTDDAEPAELLNLSEYVFSAQIRDREENGTIVYATFEIDTTFADNGKITIHLGADETRIPPGFWDLQLAYPSLPTITILKGRVKVSGDVTQEVSP